MLAAETIRTLLKRDFIRSVKGFEERVKESFRLRLSCGVMNFHAAFRHGRWLGMANAACNTSPAGAPGVSSIGDHQEPGLQQCRSFRLRLQRRCRCSDKDHASRRSTDVQQSHGTTTMWLPRATKPASPVLDRHLRDVH
jgi:hypothetical protein